ncbi:MAG: DNA cytosine methyltransferase [Planctomycetota bacterium]
MNTHIRTTVLAIGQHRGAPRIYIEGRYLLTAGFAPGSRYEAVFAAECIELTLTDEGRAVSGKKQNTIGVIDLNGQSILDTFGQADRVTVACQTGRITLTLSRITALRRQRELNDQCVDLFAGGGLLSEAARQAGFRTVAAIEIDRRYADIHQANHGGHMINTSIEEAPWDQLRTLALIGLLAMGIPCEPYSAVRRLDRGGQAKRDQTLPPEAHELGDMVYWALKATDILNPHTVVIEEVPRFLASGAYFILTHALRRMGYHVDDRIINPLDHGALTGWQRAVVVGTTLEEVRWPEPCARPHHRRLGEILDDVPLDDDMWFDRETKPWLFAHWDKQTAKGNGFEPPKLTADSTRCPTIKKRYFAGQGDNPVVAHPRKTGVYRWLTIAEVRRLMNLPGDYDLGTAKTTAGEILGQGVEVHTFTRIIRAVTRRAA